MFVMFSGGFWSSFKVLLTLIAPSVNTCPQTPMERFYLCIKFFYFLIFFLFTQNGAWVRPILGPCGKDIAGVSTLPDYFLKISPEIFITDPSSQFKLHSYLPTSGIRLTSYSGLSHTVPFLCASLPPSLCSWCSLWPERNQSNSLLAEPFFSQVPSWGFDWVCTASGLIFSHCAIIAPSCCYTVLLIPWTC